MPRPGLTPPGSRRRCSRFWAWRWSGRGRRRWRYRRCRICSFRFWRRLSAMGYGGGDLANARMTRASGDGGIDGIIHEDALGLDAVYVQAKRYAPDIKVGRPAIQQFIGSLTGEGATKGVFVTTSDFSAEARGYLGKVQHRVVLIDGRRLAQLMIRHGVGVRNRTTYVIRGIDEDYFADLTAG
ncbi:MAG: restriction endonuclease [Alphaproteobacteria bacterium HGW-Alphaproteobacteria-6]|nr:MAG: restriction endonuclease [Alphaproteobacteria bacterium HGW-Alphaproteobacteria-6]